jgi:flagellar assembly protein FliH
MALAKPVPFLFNNDFDGRQRGEEMIPMSQHLAAISESEQRAFAAGEIEGRSLAMDSETARLARTMDKLAATIAAEIARSEARFLEQERSSIELALCLAEKLAGGAIAKFPLASIEAAAQEAFAEARTAPHIAVRINDGLVEQVKERLTHLAAERGFAGKLIVLGDPDIPQGDVRLEWADGGVVRDRAAIASAIDRTIKHHIESVTGKASGEPT